MTTERDSTMTLEQVRNRLANLVEHSKCPDTVECERFIEAINEELATRDAVVISNELLHGHLAPTYGEPDEDGVGYFFTCEDLEKFVAACAESLASPKVAVPDGIAVAAAYIQKKADDYAAENCGTEYDTGATTYHYGQAGMDYHHTLIELAEEVAMLSAAPHQSTTEKGCE